MARAFERKVPAQGLTLKLYRGEGAALLAFDLDASKATPDFVGFSVEVKYPGAKCFGALKNRLHFDLPANPERPRLYRSTEAPFQKFRWIHVPTQVGKGEFRYRVSAKYMDAAMVHHKFVVTDFNGAPPTVFTGSSNMARGGEEDKGDHLIWIEDRKLAIVYAIEALRLFDPFHFRVNAESANAPGELRLARPPTGDRRPWFASYYRRGHVKERDRMLFVR